MRLVDAYRNSQAPLYLYALLVERPAAANINHRQLPTAAQHLAFYKRRPYLAWYLVMKGKTALGSVYLTHDNEIGVFIFREHQGKGYGSRAVRMLKRRYGRRRYLANIAPGNRASISLFSKLGARHVQNTYEL